MTLMIKIANRDEVDAVWPLLAARMQRGCDKTGNTISPAELWQMVRSGNGFLVIGWDDASVKFGAVWRVETLPTGPALRCMGLAGADPGQWIGPHYDFMMQQATQNGATRLIANGRVGWSRILAKQTGRKVRLLSEEFEVL